MVLRLEQRGATRILTVDRPAVKNAINRALVSALGEALADAERDPHTSALVLASSSSDVFLSGGDLDELARLPLDAAGASQVTALGADLAVIERLALPVIAAVEGAVFGGGCELLVLCDVVVMAESATLSFVHARMGLTPAWGGATRLIERIGAARATELLLSGRSLDAHEACGIGLAARVCVDGQAVATAAGIAADLAQRPRAALAAIKRSLLAVREARRGPALEAETRVFGEAWGSAPHRAAFAALKKKA